ncbi:M23 family metallopeptidase [Proteiniphilum sp.]|uniref:M23 family metallopeptidase n=1 Tax=Proteiniphilum sp. TaxID=1926877 RepID=UPI0033327C66
MCPFKLQLVLFLFSCHTLLSYSQQYRNPVTISPALSANFGELRNNHFHSGIDFKTQQVVDKPIVAIEDGYVSRISISPGGYGLALYVDHPSTGHTSVYAHLNSFSKEIDEWVKEQQYQLERFSVTLYPEPGLLPVKKGEQIALSGNTGGSGGPHLHFEIRDTQTEEPMDALEFLPDISDTRKPDLQGIAFYPVTGKGVVNGSINPVRLNIGKDKAGNPLSLPREIEAWGRIGVGVKGYDRMDGQNNIYGVKHIRLFVDDRQVFSSTVDRYSFADTRMLNTFVDFEDWRKRKSFFMKSFIEPGNRLPFYETENSGYIDINEERPYRFRYELEDHYGNRLTYHFTVQGKPRPIPERPECDHWMAWNLYNTYMDTGFQLQIPKGNLYDDICFSHSSTRSPNHYSNLHRVNDSPVPLHDRANIWIGMHTDTLQNKQNYGIVKVSDNGSESWVGGEYVRGGISVGIRELGDRYAVSADTIAPVITPVEPTSWVSQKRLRIRLTDNKSGIASFRGEINGEYILFTHDIKSSVYTYRFDDSRLTRGQEQVFTFTVVDGAGNSNEYQYNFYY